MSLQSLTTPSFTLSITIFEKGACQQSTSFPQATSYLWNLQLENWGKLAFSQLSHYVTYWNVQTNPASTVTELLAIILKNEILTASTFYQRKIIQQNILQTEIFSKSFTGWNVQSTVFSVKIWTMLRHWNMPSE